MNNERWGGFALLVLVIAWGAFMILSEPQKEPTHQEFTTHKSYAWTYGGEGKGTVLASSGSYGEIPPDPSWELMAEHCGPGPVVTDVTCVEHQGCDYKTNCTPHK